MKGEVDYWKSEVITFAVSGCPQCFSYVMPRISNIQRDADEIHSVLEQYA